MANTDYHYPNAQNAQTIWYHVSNTVAINANMAYHTEYVHNHTECATSIDVYLGLEGFYFLTDNEVQALKLPTGRCDIPLWPPAKLYSANCTSD
jgi:hypothetical protein